MRKANKNEVIKIDSKRLKRTVSIKEAIRTHLKSLMDIKLVPKQDNENGKCKGV